MGWWYSLFNLICLFVRINESLVEVCLFVYLKSRMGKRSLRLIGTMYWWGCVMYNLKWVQLLCQFFYVFFFAYGKVIRGFDWILFLKSNENNIPANIHKRRPRFSIIFIHCPHFSYFVFTFALWSIQPQNLSIKFVQCERCSLNLIRESNSNRTKNSARLRCSDGVDIIAHNMSFSKWKQLLKIVPHSFKILCNYPKSIAIETLKIKLSVWLLKVICGKQYIN